MLQSNLIRGEWIFVEIDTPFADHAARMLRALRLLRLRFDAARRYAEAIFLFLCTIIPLLTSTNAYPRYLFGLYPTMLALVLLVRNKPTLRPLLLALSALLSAYFTIAWVNAKFFVV